VDVARKKKPALAKKIDDLRTKMRDPGADRQSMQGDMRKLYDDLGVDMRTAGACSRRADGGAAGTAGATGVAGQRGGGRGGLGGANFARGQGGGGRGQGGGGQGGRGNSDRGPRNGLIFVQRGTTWQPMVLRLGVANYDVTEVLSDSLKEGDKVAMLSAAALQAARQAQMDRQKASSSPLGGAQPARGGGRGQ
jgi:hypothetical protein